MSVADNKITVMPPGGRKRGSGTGGGNPSSSDWRDSLVRNEKGKPTNCVHNLMLVLANDPFLDGLFVLDEFANAIILTRDAPWPGGHRDEFTDQDAVELAAWVGHPNRYTLATKPESVLSCVEAIARRRSRHPVREYLQELQWDGKQRIASMFRDLFGAEHTDYTVSASACFMVSAVARVLWADPDVRYNGAQVDFMLILEGDQGKGKTSAVRSLFGARWYAEAMESPAGKDFYQSLRGRWCVEIGEMDSFNKSDVTKVKQAITSRFDTYRPSYGRVSRSFRRECVFVGTTNDNEYLRDPTGGRRFLPVRVSAVKVDEIERQRDQLWAEAMQLFREGYPWWQLPAEASNQQEARYSADSWEDIIVPWLDGRCDDKTYPARLAPTGSKRPDWVTTTELLANALGIDVGKHGRPEQMRIATIMKRLGWHRSQKIEPGESKKARRWERVATGGGRADTSA